MRRLLGYFWLMVCCGCLVWGEGFREELLYAKLQLLKEDLEAHNFQRLIHYFAAGHLEMNVEVFFGEGLELDAETIDMLLLNWGFMSEEQIGSLREVKVVKGFDVIGDEVLFEVVLENGERVILSAMVDWETLLLAGASG